MQQRLTANDKDGWNENASCVRTVHSGDLGVTGIAAAVADVVRSGGSVIFPTDTVYGLGCDPASEAAVARLFALKRRPEHKPLSLHFGGVAELLAYVGDDALARRVAAAFLPGPLTLIVARPAAVGRWVTSGGDTVGLRAPKHALCAAILARCGPLAATSANFSGRPSLTGTVTGTVKEALPAADLHVDDGPTPVGVESTIVEVSTGEVRLVREGAISVAMLEQELGPVLRPAAGRKLP